jgi:hypothetical protein
MCRSVGIETMEIPDEAVEAAAKAIMGCTDNVWVVQTPRVQESAREDARAAIEAAAPYLMARCTITTIDELDALLEGAMVRTYAGFYLKEALRHGVSTWVTTNEQYYFKTDDIPLPATVIYNPYRSAGAGE